MTHTIKKTKTLVAAMLSMLIIFAACKKDEPQPEPPVDAESITISAADDFTLAIGQDTILTASVLPENTTDKTIAWTVVPATGVVTLILSAEGVTVETAGVGEATITATAASGATASVTVNVIPPAGGIEEVNGEWQIYTEEGLIAFAKKVNGDNYGTTTTEGSQFGLNAKLMDNITLTSPAEGDSNWTPIGWRDRDIFVVNAYYGYYGTFDGNGKTISGLVINSDDNEIGLFGALYKNNDGEEEFGTVKNLTLMSPVVSGEQYVGAIVGYAKGATIENCNVQGESASVTGTGSYVGGVVGAGQNAAITACYNTASVTGNNNNVGGVVGYGGSATITACYNTASVKGYASVGGVVGNGSSATITECYNTASVVGRSNVGGVVGYGAYGTITACYNSASVEVIGNQVGGVVGSGFRATIAACYNTASVTGTGYNVGGVVGSGRNATITACYNSATASVEGTGDDVGGVVGNGEEATITACYNSASISGAKDIGGVVGFGDAVTISTIYWIDNADDTATTAIGDGEPSSTEGSMDATDLTTLNSETAVGALNAAILQTVTNDQGVEIAVNYHFAKGDSTPKLVKKE